MKTRLLFLLGCMTFSLSAQLQFDIESTHFSIPISDTAHSVRFFGGNNLAMPTISATQGQAWNYTLPFGIDSVTQFNPYDNNPNFPDAEAVIQYQTSLSDAVIEGAKAYYKKNSTGYYFLGIETDIETFELGSVTGQPNDTLKILNTVNYFGDDAPIVQYPLNMGSAWSSEVDANIDFELTVQTFNLEDEPGTWKRTIITVDTVVSFGTLTTQLAGYTNVPAIIAEHSVTTIDSFFVGGQPANALLLSFFNLTQGEVRESKMLQLYTQGSGQAQRRPTTINFYLNQAGNDIEGGDYTNDIYLSTSVVDFSNGLDIQVYPNPVSNGSLFLERKGDFTSAYNLSMVDMSGKVHVQKIWPSADNHFDVDMRVMPSGIYTLILESGQARKTFTIIHTP